LKQIYIKHAGDKRGTGTSERDTVQDTGTKP